MRSARIDPVPIVVAVIGLVSTGGAIVYGAVRNAAQDPCAVAREWVGDDTPNPALSVRERAALSAVMVRKLMECSE